MVELTKRAADGSVLVYLYVLHLLVISVLEEVRMRGPDTVDEIHIPDDSGPVGPGAIAVLHIDDDIVPIVV